MKKIITFVIMIFSIIILTGCGTKTIICNGNLTEDDIIADVKVSGIFKYSKLSMQIIEMTFDLTEYLQYTDIYTFYDSFTEQYNQFNGYRGISVDIKQNDSSIIVIMNIDLDNVDEDTYRNLNLGSGNLEVSEQVFINEFERMDFICK